MNKLVEQLLQVERWPQVVLFVGPRHSNKEDLTQHAMRQLICSHPKAESCVSCPVDLFRHPDVYLITPQADESLISLEAVKAGITHLYQSPFLSSKKILLIQASELLSTEAANALLKPIEDYHPNRHIFLLTTTAEQILPTIRSRSVMLSCLANNPVALNKATLSALEMDLEAFPQVILDHSRDRFQLVERLHTALAKLPNAELRTLLTEEAVKWQTVFLQAHRTNENRIKKQQFRLLVELCERVPALTQQHVSLKTILETLITTI